MTLPSDISALRLVLECNPSGLPSMRQIGGDLSGKLQMDWVLEEAKVGQLLAQLKVRSNKPPETLYFLTTTTTNEVPMEVVRTQYLLATWHRWLISLAILFLLSNTLRDYLHSWEKTCVDYR